MKRPAVLRNARTSRLLVGCVAGLMSACPPAGAQPGPGTNPDAPKTAGPEKPTEEKKDVSVEKVFDLHTAANLTGDWGGTRTELKNKGFVFDLAYHQQFQQVLKGGLETHNSDEFSGSYDFDIALDFGKFGWMEEAGFFIRTTGSWGDGVNESVGALFPLNADAQGDHIASVSKWWVWKKFAKAKLELRLGLLQAHKDLFDVSLYANNEDKDFMNRASFRNPTLPLSTGMGAFLRYSPVSWFYAQAIAFDTDFQARTTGFNSGFHDRAWFTTVGEAGFTPKWESEKGLMPGRYRMGVWYDPRTKSIFRDTLGGRRDPATNDGDVGYYFGVDQMVWKENCDPKDTQGWGVFARYGHAHGDRNRVDNGWQLGTSIKGLIPTRDADVLGFSVAQGMLSEHYRDELRRLADRETVYEVYYAYQPAPWIIISPDLQFITNPGGDKDDRDAIVGGVRVRIVF